MHNNTTNPPGTRLRPRRRAKANRWSQNSSLGPHVPSSADARRHGATAYLGGASTDSLTPRRRIAPVFELPYELLAEFASYLSSPDLLSLARSCKLFCHTLVDTESAHIWRAARANCMPNPLPDPCAPNWTESAYAAFVFDDTPCDVRPCRVSQYRTFAGGEAPVSIFFLGSPWGLCGSN